HKYQLEFWVTINKNNIVRLKKFENKEEREWIVNHISLVRIPQNKRPQKAKTMIDLINSERHTLGLQPVWR
ncbi:MAG: hypothetical protein AAB221_11945, partial [Bacteroidota bacterium]